MECHGIERVRDLRVMCRRAGSGPLVVLVHGLAQDHAIWFEVQQGLPGFTTLAYDVRGHGSTSLADANGTLDQLGGDLVALLERCGAAACVVGFSLGGTIALWAAAERPDLVRSVAAVATSSVVGSAAAAGLRARIELFEQADDVDVRDAVASDTRAQLASDEVDVEAIVAARMRAIGNRGGYLNGARAMERMRAEPLNDRLERIAVPVLVVTGEHDVVCPRRAANIMLEHLHRAALAELPGVGHLIVDVRPGLLTSVLRRWFADQSRS
jgi:pimeloyl-ACP methyl ester carboxylesterase